MRDLGYLLGRGLEFYRLEENWSRYEAAHMADCSVSHIQKTEEGRFTSLDAYDKLAKAYGLESAQLLTIATDVSPKELQRLREQASFTVSPIREALLRAMEDRRWYTLADLMNVPEISEYDRIYVERQLNILLDLELIYDGLLPDEARPTIFYRLAS